MSTDCGVPEVSQAERHEVSVLFGVIRDLAHRAEALERLVNSAHSPQSAMGRVLVDLDLNVWIEAVAVAVTPRPQPPRDLTGAGQLRDAIHAHEPGTTCTCFTT